MRKIRFLNIISDIYTSSKWVNLLIFLLFSILLTALLASKYFFFQSLISVEGTSLKEIKAPKTIKVIDTFKTEQLKKEVSAKVEPILTPAEDTYIKNNLLSIFNTIEKIRQSDDSNEIKKSKIEVLFYISDNSTKNYILNYFLSSSDDTINEIKLKASEILDNILKEGITEKVFEKDNISRIIFKYMPHNVSQGQIRIISALLEQVIMPNMVVDELATEIAKKNAANSVSPYIIKFEKGENIVFQGEPVTKVKREALSKAGYNVLELNYLGLFGIYNLVIIGILSLIYYLQFFDKKYLVRNYLSIIGMLVLIMAAIGATLNDSLSIYLLPFGAFSMLLAIFTNPRISIFASVLLVSIMGITLQISTQAVVVFSIISLISAISASRIRYSRRVDLIKSGIEISLGMLLLISCTYIIEMCVVDISMDLMIKDIISGIFTGFSSGIIVLGSIPILESVFKIITPFGLAELADHNQPLLKRLQFEAPGTFAHSLSVSNLCEAASESIVADPILARVGALYHDIGKLKRPLFFVENQSYFGIDNPHSKLNPRLSKMVIMAHPRDGMDLAREYHLPSQIQDFIIQHHGETLASYFYNEAIKQEGIENVSKDQFRYSGPKPNTKETAILMIVDAVESASRTLKDFSQEAIDNMIQKIINDRLEDGQLSDSPLTLKDLKIISSTLNRLLRAAHHQRVKYHENIIHELENKGSKLPNTLLDVFIDEKLNMLDNGKNMKNEKNS